MIEDITALTVNLDRDTEYQPEILLDQCVSLARPGGGFVNCQHDTDGCVILYGLYIPMMSADAEHPADDRPGPESHRHGRNRQCR